MEKKEEAQAQGWTKEDIDLELVDIAIDLESVEDDDDLRALARRMEELLVEFRALEVKE
tara:strand:- start:240 stop:416 length:177 start_codon:yes stop_codon:yes gene_type:complete